MRIYQMECGSLSYQFDNVVDVGMTLRCLKAPCVVTVNIKDDESLQAATISQTPPVPNKK